MKLRWIGIFSALFLLCGCSFGGSQTDMNQTDTPTNATKEFREHGLSFAVPETWGSSGFEVEFDEVKNGSAAYDTRTFYAMIDGMRTPVLMVSRFAREQWDKLVSEDASAEESKLGTSKDGKFVYTYLMKDDILPETEKGKSLLEKIREEATKLRDSIKITE